MNWKSRVQNYPFLWRLTKGSPSPVGWVGFGYISLFFAKTFSPRLPPVLVLSLPRSGSSWVGEILGNATNALYLREPVTQSNMQQRGENRAILHVDKDGPDIALQRYANNAFNGLPDFLPGIIHDVKQWDIKTRSRKKVVIKEVNPLAAGWLISEFAPQVIFLVRHPAAVAASYNRLGWRNPHLSDVYSSLNQIHRSNPSKVRSFSNTNDFWTNQGLMQGGCLSYAMAVLAAYPNTTIVKYEDLCEYPTEHFRKLFRSTGLTWSSQSEKMIQEKTSSNDQKGAYSTSRDSKSMPWAWTKHVSREEVNRLRTAFSGFSLPWYTSDDDWFAGFCSASSDNG